MHAIVARISVSLPDKVKKIPNFFACFETYFPLSVLLCHFLKKQTARTLALVP